MISDATEPRASPAHQYLGTDYPPEGLESERVVLWVTPERPTISDRNEDTSD